MTVARSCREHIMENLTPFRPLSVQSRSIGSSSAQQPSNRRVLVEINKQDSRIKEIELKTRQENKKLQRKLEIQEKATHEILQQLRLLQENLSAQKADKPRRLPSELTVSFTIHLLCLTIHELYNICYNI